jgi:endoglucanase
MVLSFHKYGNFNTDAAIQNFLTMSKENNVPLWLGESGENSNTWFTDCIRLVEGHDIGWSWWQEKKIGINNPLEIKLTPSYQKLLDHWNGKAPKPSQAEAVAALDDFLENIKLENNIYHKDVTDAMFRQVHTTATVPFKKLSTGTPIQAVDYDLGRQRYAYYDRDTARYQYTPGVNTDGNRGHMYRNDGVDIKAEQGSHYVFNIEDGEWLKYTINAKAAGDHTMKLTVRSANGKGKIAISVADKLIGTEMELNKAGQDWYTIEVKNIPLKKSANQIKIIANEGGFELRSFELVN